MNLEFIGFVAGMVTFSAQIPQVIKSWRTKRTYDISLPLYSLLFVGIALWITYGWFTNTIAVFVMNCVLEVLISMMIYLKLRYGLSPSLGMRRWYKQYRD